MKIVKWKTPSPQSSRMVTDQEWQRVGVENQDTLVWNQANDWTVPARDVSDHAMQHLVLDGGFVVEGEDDDQPSVSEPAARGIDKPRTK